MTSMFGYRKPGVYFESTDVRPSIIGIRRTDITGFVGITARGQLHQPIKVESWAQFTTVFGEHIHQAYLPYAVDGFFKNGGQTCWVVRVADPEQSFPSSLMLSNRMGRPVLFLVASSPGIWGQKITVNIVETGEDNYSFSLKYRQAEQEFWPNLSLQPENPQFAVHILNDPQTGSRLIRACELNSSFSFPINRTDPLQLNQRVASGKLLGGKNGIETLRIDHFNGEGSLQKFERNCTQEDLQYHPWGLRALELIDEVSIVVMPDIMPKPKVEVHFKERKPRCDTLTADENTNANRDLAAENPPVFDEGQILELQSALISHCERLKDRVAILDPLFEDLRPEIPISRLINRRNLFQSKYAAFYYPWVLVPDPLVLEGDLKGVPPSGHMAGVYARVDQVTGVHKPPANEVIHGVQDVSIQVNDVKHGELNTAGVNVIRAFRGRGIRVAGARALSKEKSCRYINVRRLLIMISEAIEEQTQWTVFEPNNTDQWLEIDRVVRSFLNDLWQRGMLDGATAEEAYFVKCDHTTNPPEQTERGLLVCRVGVQPPWPAEFVIVRIGKTESGIEISETEERQNGPNG